MDGAVHPPRRVTITDVARRAGVSPGAVSFALNDRPGVAADTRERILATAKQLGWEPNLRARSLSRSTSYALGLVVARSTATVSADPFFPAFVAGVNGELEPVRRCLLHTTVADEAAELATYRRLAAEQRVDGVFVTDLRVGDPRPRLLASLGLPAVTLGRVEPSHASARVGSVTVDEAPAVHELVADLVARGHRRIAHVTGPEQYHHVVRRREAWRTALGDHGLPADLYVHTDFSAARGAAATEDLLALRRRPTAIVYANDVMAIAGLAAARRRGLAVPQDLSVTGFDDTELARHVDPPLTTVQTDVVAWGRAAARALLAAADGGAARHLNQPRARVVHRTSVSAAPTHHRKGSR